jgi:hypothetical protein
MASVVFTPSVNSSDPESSGISDLSRGDFFSIVATLSEAIESVYNICLNIVPSIMQVVPELPK